MPPFVDPKAPKPGLPGEAPKVAPTKSVSVSVTPFRYFLVSYQAGPLLGDVAIHVQGFPSARAIRAHISAMTEGKWKPEQVVILFFSEFKSREDFEAFNK